MIEELRQPIRQRAPRVMVHIAVAAANGGTVLNPHFVDPGEKMTAEYSVSMLKTDAMPQVATSAAEGELICFQQDLASPHHGLPQGQWG